MRIGTISGALACVVIVASGMGRPHAQSSTEQWTPITAARLSHPEAGDWLNYRRTYDVTGYSPLTQINRGNVATLRSIWSYSLRDSSRWLPTPIVANGLMYVSEGTGRVIAFDVVSGDVVWIHERHYPDDIAISEAYRRARGVSVYGDRIYWTTADCYLVALDARTGALAWEVSTGDYHTGEGHNHPPLIADGKIFVGHAGGDRTAQGRFRAYDADTGALLWTVYTAPRPGDPGYDTWTKREVPPLGAAPWNTASYDPDLHLVYFSTGQPAPWSVTLRGRGDALYTNSVLAVDAGTGTIRWHFQISPEDSWDRAAFENVLVDLVIGGRTRKALIQTGKIGWGVVLDRQTGEFLSAFKTAYDNVITGWTKEGRPIYNPKALPTPADVDSGKIFEICPHIHGARNLQASSYSPLTRLYYLGINNSCMNASVVSEPYVVGRRYAGVSYTPKLAPGYDYVGEFVAFDPVAGTRAWTYRPDSGAAMSASALSTAGGIVFGGTADRQFFALNTETGERLWQSRLNGDVSGAPITFTVAGNQYVAIGAGGRAAPSTSFGPLTGVDIPQGTGAIWVFALPSSNESKMRPSPSARRPVLRTTSGHAPAVARATETAPNRGSGPTVPPASVTAAPTSAASGGGVPSQQVAGRSMLDGVFTATQATQGEQRYAASCSVCHNVSEHTGPALRNKWAGRSLDDIFALIATTMPDNNPGSLSADEYASIVAFFLRQTGYSPGALALPADRAVLQKLKIESVR